ncbi:hypothetical protein SAMN06297229_2302 [Pseudidiomarina planktonica]|uniref:Amidohydrolase 3 domain-containing protein n=1 Tax=Pseudidiomarina planktonica TaxID=1323738 RepID=A0A1Y6FXF7_9GAMM|nr:amidohydrolase [Pseudidiomarina planktonica]RUO63241.1 amidohydrolase [Pseudidiomarina planktonica]SMQ80545.1 hypothetical protein SAMN06297229_2302 [Pseudidiomarina planktonica]
MNCIRLAAVLCSIFITCPSLAATQLYFNTNGYTLTGQPGADAKLKEFSVLVVADGRIVAVGGDELKQRYAEADQKVDLNGKTVLPGITDAHGHVLGLGDYLLQADLREATSAQDAVARVASYATANEQQPWIIGRGWNQENWPDRTFPTASMLDEVIQQRPVWLTRVDAHAGWANSKALELAGITADTMDPDGGEIVRDADGNPTGVLIDNAMNLVDRIRPIPSAQQLGASFERAFEHLLARGITGVHDAGISAAELSVYKQLAADKQLPVRVYGMLAATEPRLPELLAEGPVTTPDESFTVASVKIYADGALGSRGAALLEPYSDADDQMGLMVTSEQGIEELYDLVIPAGFQINIHAIGDRANRIALDQFERAYETMGGRNLRHRIEHAQVVHPDDLKRFKSLNVIASMQPTHATSDKNMAEDRLGKARMEGAYAWQTLLEQGTIIAAGSDFPVELANPFFGLHAAVTRQDRDNNPAGGWYAHEQMTLPQALRAFTLDAAYASGQEQSLGSLEPGKWADFIVLEQDPFSVNSTILWQTDVLATYVAGEKRYSRSNSDNNE